MAAGDTRVEHEGPREPLHAGRVGRAHGLDGSFYVTGARPALLTQGATVTVADRALRIVRRAGVDARPIVRLEGIEGRPAAEELRGMALTVARGDAPALNEGEWWAHELEGCLVYDGARQVGAVEGMTELPSCEVLRVRTVEGGELLVPMVRDAIKRIDPARRRIDIDGGFLGESWS